MNKWILKKLWIRLPAEIEVSVKGKKNGVEKTSCSWVIRTAEGPMKTILLQLVSTTLLTCGKK